MQSNSITPRRCFGGPGRPNCQNEPTDGLFCDTCRRALRTPRQTETRQPEPVYTACCCGAPLKPGQVLCDPCEARVRPQLFRTRRRPMRKKIVAVLAALLLALTLACDANVGDGSCRGPACYSNQGGNP